MFKKKKIRSGSVGVKGGALYRADGSATGGNIETLDEALAANTECGCGIECVCYGFLKLRNFNSTTGKYDYMVMYFVDGAPVFATEEDAIDDIQSMKDIAGGLIPA